MDDTDQVRLSIKDRISQYETRSTPAPPVPSSRPASASANDVNYRVYKPRQAPSTRPAVAQKPAWMKPASPVSSPVNAAAPPLPARPGSRTASVSTVSSTSSSSLPPALPRRPPQSKLSTESTSFAAYDRTFDRLIDERLFTSSEPNDRLTEREVSFVWMHSKLPVNELKRLWHECDADKRGSLGRAQFRRGCLEIDKMLATRKAIAFSASTQKDRYNGARPSRP